MSLMRGAVTAFSRISRRRKAHWIGQFLNEPQQTSLFVGCRPSMLANVNINEREVARRTHVLACLDTVKGSGDALPWAQVVADARDMPFADSSVDFVLANAVIEHVGDEVDQVRFVSEQTRVARSWVITTPNRWYPVESHTAVILKHWSPRWRAERHEFTRLLSRSEFVDLLPPGAVVRGRWWSATFAAYFQSLDMGGRGGRERHATGCI